MKVLFFIFFILLMSCENNEENKNKFIIHNFEPGIKVTLESDSTYTLEISSDINFESRHSDIQIIEESVYAKSPNGSGFGRAYLLRENYSNPILTYKANKIHNSGLSTISRKLVKNEYIIYEYIIEGIYTDIPVQDMNGTYEHESFFYLYRDSIKYE